jgi:hypothetical protein
VFYLSEDLTIESQFNKERPLLDGIIEAIGSVTDVHPNEFSEMDIAHALTATAGFMIASTAEEVLSPEELVAMKLQARQATTRILKFLSSLQDEGFTPAQVILALNYSANIVISALLSEPDKEEIDISQVN